jgi:hypothetical protein
MCRETGSSGFDLNGTVPFDLPSLGMVGLDLTLKLGTPDPGNHAHKVAFARNLHPRSTDTDGLERQAAHPSATRKRQGHCLSQRSWLLPEFDAVASSLHGASFGIVASQYLSPGGIGLVRDGYYMGWDMDRWPRTAVPAGLGVVCLLGLGDPALGKQKNRAEPDIYGDRAPCGMVEIVDRQGRPLPGALVSLNRFPDGVKDVWYGPSNEWETDRKGTVCEPALLVPGGILEIEAPTSSGGRCGGLRRLKWTQAAPDSGKLRIVLDVLGVRRSSLRGRILSPEQQPIAGAKVKVIEIERLDLKEFCPIHPTIETTSNKTGTFVLPRVTHGQVLLHISHRKFAEINYQVNVPSPPKGIVLYRGATWKGRVLDPDGEILDQCKIQFADPTKTILVQSSCSREGFVLDHLPPGDGSIEIRLDFHPHLGKRVVASQVHIATDEQRNEDIRWPAGIDISGRVVDKSGTPIERARVFAKHASNKYYDDGSEHGVMVDTDREGRFVFRHMGAGDWVLEVYIRAEQKTRVIVPAGTMDVQIVVDSQTSAPKAGD